MFRKAEPVAKPGCRDEMNLFFGFYTRIPKAQESVLRITGASQYSVYVGEQFVFSGPARAAHGYYRVDEIPLMPYLQEGDNVVTIRLTVYQCNSFSLIDVEGFLCAEIESDGEVIRYTAAHGAGGFGCVQLQERIQKVVRYSFQRNFTEAYRLDEAYRNFFTEPEQAGKPAVDVERTQAKRYLPRGVFYPLFEQERPKAVIAGGQICLREPNETYRERLHKPTDRFKCFALSELEHCCVDDISAMEFLPEEVPAGDGSQIHLDAMQYVDLEFPVELTGFLQLELEAVQDSDVFLTFDEVYNDNNVNFQRIDPVNCISLFAKAGSYRFMTMEPYSLKYLRLVCRRGSVTVKSLQLRRAGYPDRIRRFPVEDPELKKIYEAAVETFRQNTYDIYMDCPSRERAGWLCDSFFTARTEYALTGDTQVERNFLSNFLDLEGDPNIPEGMLPMCYPADHTDHKFIPNWAMWFVVELEEYLHRSADQALIDRAEPKVMALMDFFRRYENEFGLLEKLPSWVFLEWSRSNDLVQDVNFPSNMLYARVKRTVARLYGISAMEQEAEQIETYIRENTMVDGFFCDNALRQEDGRLVLSGECTESCQYYAFFTGTATPQTHEKLWKTLCVAFGPHRREENPYPQIAFANAFIGNYLRLELLAQYGCKAQLEAEIRGYFLYMAEKTGTLWEHVGDYASCNHGFASYTAVLLEKALS